jgi:hypothetical protein
VLLALVLVLVQLPPLVHVLMRAREGEQGGKLAVERREWETRQVRGCMRVRTRACARACV